MEVAGLVLGIAGLYSVCSEILGQFDTYKDFGSSSSQLAVRFEAEKLRLREWAHAAGIRGGELAENHHPRLDDLAVRAIVYQILYSIIDLFPRAEQILIDIRGKSSHPPNREVHGLDSIGGGHRVSRKAKIKWAFGTESRFSRQIEALELLTSKLYDLVPLTPSLDFDDDGTVAGAGRPDLQGTSVEDVQLFSKVLADLKALQEYHKDKALAEDQRAVYEFLRSPRTSEDFDNSLSKCLPGTCGWIFSLPAYQAWVAASNTTSARLLWLNGTAGSGKSVLCSRVISHLRSFPNIHCFHFFCTTHVQAGGVLDDIIRVWLYEMVKADQACLEAMIDLMFQTKTSTLSFNIWHALKVLMRELGNCVFVVDGLDEFIKIDDQRQAFVEKLKRCLAWTEARILITSRDEVDLRRGIEEPEQGIDIALHKISPADTETDIKLFSQEIVKQKLGAKDQQFQAELAATLADRSEGMFLWIALSGKYLRGGLSKARILQTIKNVPDGLLSAYTRSWKFILDQPEYERSRALDILGWCIWGFRPLTVAELTVALIINIDHVGPLDTTDLPDEINDEYINGEIIDLCSSLVETRSSTEHEVLARRTVHIVHFSVKDFLVSAAANLEYSEKEVEIHRRLARKCLWYLCHKSNATGDSQTTAAFHDYAINHWHTHRNLSNPQEDQLLIQLMIDLFTSHPDKFSEWAVIYEKSLPSKSEDEQIILKPSPIYFATSLNSTTLLHSFIEKGDFDINAQGGKLGAAVHAACYYGNEEALKILINSAVDLNNSKGLYGTALHVAVAQNHPRLVTVLLEHSVLLNLKSSTGQTPLFIAAANGHDDMVKSLLAREAVISTSESSGWTPLNIAAYNGRLSAVKLLLDAGADMTPTDDGQTPLHSAAIKGHLSIVRAFINCGASPLTATLTGWTPLHSACKEQRIDVVKFLLTFSTTDVNKPSPGGYSPVNTVSELGNLELVMILCDNGADLRMSTLETGFTPLHNASWRGHLPIVQYILNRDPHLITVTNKGGCTPVYSAAQGGRPETLAFLLSRWPEMVDIACDQWTPLNAAAVSGYQECLEILLAHGATIDITQSDGQTPIYSAARSGHVNVVRTLLKHGGQATIPRAGGWTPLMAAVSQGNLEITEILVSQAGLDVNAKADDGAVALHTAVLGNNLAIVQFLIDHGARTTAAANSGATILHNGVRGGNVELVKLLLDNGADASLSSTDASYTPLHLASSLGQSQVLKLLVDRGADIHALNSTGMTSLNLAVTEGRLDAAKVLLSLGADMRGNNEEQTPLNNASYHGHREIAVILLDYGAGINVLNKMGWTPLNAACFSNHIQVVKLLLDRGADLQIPNIDGSTPLHSAAVHDSPALVKLLVEKGAKVNQATKPGLIPLMSAARKNQIETVRYLLDHGADMHSRDATGFNLLHLAAHYGATQVVQFLLQQGFQIDVTASGDYNSTPIYHASIEGHTDVVTMLLEAGADANCVCDNGWTPLMAAVDSNHIGVARALLKHHADPNHSSKAGSCPVLCASSSGHLEMLQLLLDAGANVAAQDAEGSGPLILASSMDHLPVVEFLIPRVTNINSQNIFGQSALLAAIFINSIDVVKVLLSHGADIHTTDRRKDTPLTAALTMNFPDLASILMDNGASVTTADDQGRTALHWAARTGSVEIVQRILHTRVLVHTKQHKSSEDSPSLHDLSLEEVLTAEVSGNIIHTDLVLQNTRSNRLPNILLADQSLDKEGRTPVHFAAFSGAIACVELLASNGFDLNVLDIRGRSILDYACMSGSTKMVAWIIEHIPAQAIDRASWSPLHWACRNGDFQLIKLLSEAGFRSTTVKTKDVEASWLPMDIARYDHNEQVFPDADRLSDEPWDLIKDNQIIEHSVNPRAAFSNSLLAQGQRFRGYCDGCFASFHGPRFHCIECADFDYCMMCKDDAHISHPLHTWNRIESL